MQLFNLRFIIANLPLTFPAVTEQVVISLMVTLVAGFSLTRVAK